MGTADLRVRDSVKRNVAGHRQESHHHGEVTAPMDVDARTRKGKGKGGKSKGKGKGSKDTERGNSKGKDTEKEKGVRFEGYSGHCANGWRRQKDCWSRHVKSVNNVETDTAKPQDVDPPSEQTPTPAAAPTRFSHPGLPDDQWNEGWIMTLSNQSSYPAQQEFDWTETLADSGAAEHVCGEHHILGAPIRPASRVVLRTADGTKVVTDFVKRVRLRTENGEKVTIDFRSASVTHPILSVSGVSKTGIRAVLGHKYGYLQKSSERLDLTCRGGLYFLRAKMEKPCP